MADGKHESVLLVADRRASQTTNCLQRAGFAVVTTFTVDHAVAMCVNRDYAAVVLDQELFIEVDGWNGAQSLKMVRPAMRIVLITRGTEINRRLPKGVDARISQQQLSQLPELIARLRVTIPDGQIR